jgi:hypothetical protein
MIPFRLMVITCIRQRISSFPLYTVFLFFTAKIMDDLMPVASVPRPRRLKNVDVREIKHSPLLLF